MLDLAEHVTKYPYLFFLFDRKIKILVIRTLDDYARAFFVIRRTYQSWPVFKFARQVSVSWFNLLILPWVSWQSFF